MSEMYRLVEKIKQAETAAHVEKQRIEQEKIEIRKEKTERLFERLFAEYLEMIRLAGIYYEGGSGFGSIIFSKGTSSFEIKLLSFNRASIDYFGYDHGEKCYIFMWHRSYVGGSSEMSHQLPAGKVELIRQLAKVFPEK